MMDITVVTSNRSCPSNEMVGTEDMTDYSSIESKDRWELIRPTKMTMPTRNRAWQQLHKQERSVTLYTAPAIKRAIDQAIADAGATIHFVLPGTPVTNSRPTTKPLIINLPDGEQIESKHTCILNLP